MPVRRALVVGVGVAGLATALRLVRSDWEVALVDRDHRPERVGFPCALDGMGHAAAARMGLLPALAGFEQPRCDSVLVDAAGTALGVQAGPATGFPLLCNSDVVAVLREALDGAGLSRRAEVLGLLPDDCGVTVTFADGGEDWFDLVVGADGSGSPVRGIAFECGHPRRSGHATASGRVAGNPAGAVSMRLSGRSMHLRPLRDGTSAVLFTWRGDPAAPLQDVFGDLRWLVPGLLSQVDDGPTARRTRHEVRVDHWVTRQIALIGDAAWCAGPRLDGGASLALGGAELLGDALDIFTDTAEALRWWENQIRPIVRHARRRSAALDKRAGTPSGHLMRGRA